MTPEEQERLQACTQEIAEILDRKAPKEAQRKLRRDRANGASTDARARQSRNCPFFVKHATSPAQGRVRRVKSLVGELRLRQNQAEQLGLKRHSRISGLLERTCLRRACERIFPGCRGRYCGTHWHRSRTLDPPATFGWTAVVGVTRSQTTCE